MYNRSKQDLIRVVLCAMCVLVHVSLADEDGAAESKRVQARLLEIRDTEYEDTKEFLIRRSFLHEIAAEKPEVDLAILKQIAEHYAETRGAPLSFAALYAYRNLGGDRAYLLENVRQQSKSGHLAQYSLLVLAYDADETIVKEVEKIGNPTAYIGIDWGIGLVQAAYAHKGRYAKCERLSDQLYFLLRMIGESWDSDPYDIHFSMSPRMVWSRERLLELCAEKPEEVAAILRDVDTLTRETGIKDLAFVKPLVGKEVAELISAKTTPE